MKWNIGDDVPRLGERLYRRDTGESAEVTHVCEAGRIPPMSLCAPSYDGDVVMQYGPGRYSVCSGGAYFWQRWKRPGSDHLLYLSFATGCNPSLRS